MQLCDEQSLSTSFDRISRIMNDLRCCWTIISHNEKSVKSPKTRKKLKSQQVKISKLEKSEKPKWAIKKSKEIISNSNWPKLYRDSPKNMWIIMTCWRLIECVWFNKTLWSSSSQLISSLYIIIFNLTNQYS